MRDLLTSNTTFLTTDEIAEAAMEYARALSDAGQTALIEFPAVVNGRAVNASALIGAGIPIASVSTLDELMPTLDGAELAVWSIQRSTDALRTRSEQPPGSDITPL